MKHRLGLPEAEIPVLRDRYFRQYGTTLRGLQANHQVDMGDYLAYVHDIPVREYLKPDPLLRNILESLSIQKVILTNADAAHASRVIAALGLEGCFDSMIDVYTLEPYCKPMWEAFEIALSHVGESNARRCILIDDIPGTVRAARDFGFTSILVDEKSSYTDGGMTLKRLADLPQLTSIWDHIQKLS